MRGDVQLAPSSRCRLDPSTRGSTSLPIAGNLGNGAGLELGCFSHQTTHEALLTGSIHCASPSNA